MSFEALKWSLNVTGLSSRQRLVLIFLADFANDKRGYAWPSIGTLAKRTGLSQSTVKRAIRDLEDAELVTVARQSRIVTGERFSNRYYLVSLKPVPFESNYRVSGDFDEKGDWDGDAVVPYR